MEWIAGLQRAIDYVEENLAEKIDYEEVAKCACSSSFHFQRVFRILCGFTLGDYIRMRRLSMAASDLAGKEDKVIDVALRYGYDTPESFTRAFTRFHGITPKEAKRGGKIKSFSRLSVKLILTGGNTMDYRIEKLEKLQVVCRRKTMTKQDTGGPAQDISAFWEECTADGTLRRLTGYFPKEPKLKGMLGICYSESTAEEKFPYGIGVEYDGRPVENGLEVVEIPAHTYAVFACRGKLPEAFQRTYKRIVTEFFPQNGQYEFVNEIELEVYPSDRLEDMDYTCEIWIAVKEKK